MKEDFIVETRDLTKEFKGFVAVSGVALRVRRHTVHALIGPNGAGKTTCFNLLTKMLPPSRGRILFNGRDITGLKPAAVARLGMVRSFQISAVFGHLTALENVRVALQRPLGTSFQFWRPERDLIRLDGRALDLLDQVGIADCAARPAGELSYGRKRALELATTLALDPEMLLLDEPMAGMGAEDVARTAALVRRVAQGRTVLMVEHNLKVVADLSDTITVLEAGRVLAEGDYDTVSRDPRVKRAYMGADETDRDTAPEHAP
jgi:branched-chain amino acid transport system ATP-binding protein